MSYHLPEVCSPLRDKRRQSDAKWRASVATCYDVLKYVVPNVKHMSKKKISKALILQECEKHIQDLEDTISYLFHVESKNQGLIALWKEGGYWSQCSMEKLHEDFTEKQRKVFHVSTHGRRCYNLLQDIKEEVFDMKADSKQITFISEDSLSLMNNSEDVSSLSLMNNSEDVSDNMMGTQTVTEFPFSVDNLHEVVVVSDLSETTADQGATEKDGDTEGHRDLQHVPSNFFSCTNTVQVRQQPRPRQRFFSDNEGDIDTALLQGLNDGGKNFRMPMHVQMCEPADLLSAHSGTSDKQQIEHGVIATSSTSVSGPSASSTSHDERCVSEDDNNLDESDFLLGSEDNHNLNVDKLTGNLYHLSKEKDYPFLLGALKADKEQEVPSMETPIKTATKIKRPRLSSDRTDIDYLNGGGSREVGCVPDLNCSTDSSLACDSIYSKCCTSHSVENKVSTLTVGASSFNSLMHSSKSDIKVETDYSSPCINYDPLLSSLNTPKFDADMSLFFCTPSDGVTKQAPKYGSARKKLNFNSPPCSWWSHSSPGLVLPDRAVPAFPVVTGFTPVKLPDELTRSSDVCSDYLTSPWKPVNSPFNCRTMPQGYINSSALVDLEDNLFCMETLDTLDFEDGFSSEITPGPTQNVENTQQAEDLLKTKVPLVAGEPSNRMKPPCRRRLEGFYDQSAAAGDFVSLSEESHVVPRLDMTFWTSEPSPSDFHSHLDSRAAVDVEAKLICLESVDSLELGGDS